MQKFFCDNCGTQVDKNETRCPKCGRYFRSVKCPKCGTSGSPDMFVNGCPSCGYAEERLYENQDFYDFGSTNDGSRSGRLAGKKAKRFSDLFYSRAIPVLVAVIIILLVLLIRIGG